MLKLDQRTRIKVPSVKANETKPMMPDVRKKGDVAVVDRYMPIVLSSSCQMVDLLESTRVTHKIQLRVIEKRVGMLTNFTAHDDSTAMFTSKSIIVTIAFRLPGGWLVSRQAFYGSTLMVCQHQGAFIPSFPAKALSTNYSLSDNII